MMLSALLLLLVFKAVSSGYEKNKGKAPKGIQSFFEPIIVYMRDEVIIPNIGEHKYKKYLPYLLTLFFFIWFNNLLGLIPTGANTSGNIAFTLTLAFFTLLMTVFSGNGNYWTHIFAMPGVPWPMYIILTPVEIMGIIIKPVALMIRLFANISAGHTIILSLISLIFISKSVIVGGPVSLFVFALTLLELFVALLQAYIFTMLTALFIGQAVEEHDHH
jgi:F-type H+-transporting ATPase subunit a